MHCELPLKPRDPEQPWRYRSVAGLHTTDNKIASIFSKMAAKLRTNKTVSEFVFLVSDI